MNLFYNTDYSAFVQDDWQVSSRFTLSFGVRYMLQTTWKERDRAQANFDFASRPARDSPLRPAAAGPGPSAQRLSHRPRSELSDSEADTNNFAPRFGFAFRPFTDNKTVIRGGAGFYYNMLPVFIGFRQMGFSNPPFLFSETFEAAPGRTFSDARPAIPRRGHYLAESQPSPSSKTTSRIRCPSSGT